MDAPRKTSATAPRDSGRSGSTVRLGAVLCFCASHISSVSPVSPLLFLEQNSPLGLCVASVPLSHFFVSLSPFFPSFSLSKLINWVGFHFYAELTLECPYLFCYFVSFIFLFIFFLLFP
jgi:hypothetical protein